MEVSDLARPKVMEDENAKIDRLLKQSCRDGNLRTCFTLAAILAGVMIRGTDEPSGSLFSCVDPETPVPVRHPLRKIRQVVNDALAGSDAAFEVLDTDVGRPSIPPTGRPGSSASSTSWSNARACCMS